MTRWGGLHGILGSLPAPRTPQGLSSPPVPGCQGGPHGFEGYPEGTLPTGGGWLWSRPCPSRLPGLESRVGPAPTTAQGSPSP